MSEWLSDEMSGNDFSGVSGQEFLKGLLMSCVSMGGLDEALDVPWFHGVLLCGPSGVGKRFLLDAFAGELLQEGYAVCKADFGLLDGNAADAWEELYGVLEEKEKCILVLEGMERIEDIHGLAEILEQKVMDGKPFVFAAATEEEEQIAASIRKMFCVIHMDYPAEEDRREFLEDKLHRYFPDQTELEKDWLAEETEGLDYVQMDTFVWMMKLAIRKSAAELYGNDTEKAVSKLAEGIFWPDREQCRRMLGHVRRKEKKPEMVFGMNVPVMSAAERQEEKPLEKAPEKVPYTRTLWDEWEDLSIDKL